jgi:hypothetical protein
MESNHSVQHTPAAYQTVHNKLRATYGLQQLERPHRDVLDHNDYGKFVVIANTVYRCLTLFGMFLSEVTLVRVMSSANGQIGIVPVALICECKLPSMPQQDQHTRFNMLDHLVNIGPISFKHM